MGGLLTGLRLSYKGDLTSGLKGDTFSWLTPDITGARLSTN
jgi:hypothetical protein